MPVRQKVLSVHKNVQRGGVQRQILALAQGLLLRGFQCDVLGLWRAPASANFDAEFRALGICPAALPEGVSERDARDGAAVYAALEDCLAIFEPFPEIDPAAIPRLCAAFAAMVRKSRPSVIHGWSDIVNILSGFAAARLGVPRVICAHRSYPPPFWYDARVADAYLRAYRRLLGFVNASMIANSEAVASAYEDWLGGCCDITTIYNGFDAASIDVGPANDPNSCRDRLGIPHAAFLVGGITRFSPEKDVDLWLDAAALVCAADEDVHFVLVGHGPERAVNHIRERRDRSELRARLHLPGAVSDVGRVYAALDAFLLSSRIESTPNVLIEAQAAGIPVVTTAVGGTAEAMLEGATGMLVRERTARGLADAVLKMSREPEWRQRAMDRGPSFVTGKFGMDRMVDQTVAVYRRTVPEENALRAVAVALSK